MNIQDYIAAQPLARERKNKNRTIGNLLQMKYWKLNEIDKAILADIVGEALTMDRQWRKVLEDNPHFRGKDYKDKTHLDVEKQRELGYNL